MNFLSLQQKENSTINALYSTPSCYLYHLNQANKTWPEKNDDFFPYAHKPNAFWTGYYTSRAAFKRYVRESNNILQVSQLLMAQVKSIVRLTQSQTFFRLYCYKAEISFVYKKSFGKLTKAWLIYQNIYPRRTEKSCEGVENTYKLKKFAKFLFICVGIQ